ncbi:hypothetical protein H5410_042424 [Solanum commersonii]|uniref:Uncharacterized protein n=1 Tax=Solanum commersonii TaxID=4109 RepID=A0A9J5XYI0_SOLCO|nr:hypothetical protein H5410_042424 [Solanum commersonii]
MHDIVFKIRYFIKCSKKLTEAVLPRLTEAKNLQIAALKNNKGKIDISETTDALEDGLLKRCLVGSFGEEAHERPTLAFKEMSGGEFWRRGT